MMTQQVKFTDISKPGMRIETKCQMLFCYEDMQNHVETLLSM